MKVSFIDNKGSKETILFNPEMLFFKDGTIIVFPTEACISGHSSEMPLFAGETKELWIDIKKGVYHTSQRQLGPGSFKIAFVMDNYLFIVRYKEKLDESIFKRIVYGITQLWK